MVEKVYINPKKFPQPSGTYAKGGVIVTNPKRLFFITGQIGVDENGKVARGDIEAQTRQALENMKTVLQEAGGTFENVVKWTVYCTDMRYFDTVQKIRREYLKEPYVASSFVGVDKLAREYLLIEMDAIAVLE
jgi:2-iminobutanoate/2-iminopropanoate deaminase